MRLWIVFVIAFLFSLQLMATEMVGAISAGMGGTGRAAVEPNESLYLNPAALALLRDFHTGFSYQSGFLAQDISRNTYSVTMTDATKEILFPGGFSYRRHNINGRGQRYKENEFRGGLGYRVTDRFSMGLGVSHLRALDPAGADVNQTNVDVGLLIGLRPEWGLSFSGENLIKGGEDIPVALQRLSRAALGTQYIYQRTFTLRYEALMPLYLRESQFLGHRMGLGIGVQRGFGLNLGYSVDDSIGQNWSSVGILWKGPRLKIAYSFQNEDRANLGVRHLVDLWVDL